jgi:A/G-specific adenine glycosylase
MISDSAERFRAGLLDWAEDGLREFPWRDPDVSLYEVFVAEFFLTQTPAENVARVYPVFLDRFPSLTAIGDADEEALRSTIEPIGFHNMRAEALARIGAENDALPRTVDGLEALERIGPYVANATLCFAFDRPLPIVDRNVDRVYGRVLGEEWPDGTTAQWEVAAQLVPEEAPKRYNLALLDFGAAVCRPDPRCKSCFATNHCEYYWKLGRN